MWKLFVFILLTVGINAEILCPALFFVLSLTDYENLGISERTEVDYGNYLLRNGTQFPGPFYLPTAITHQMWNRVPCAVLISIITDDSVMFKDPIKDWIREECLRLNKNPLHECYRPVSVDFNIETDITSSPTIQPTIQPTNAPSLPETCHERSDKLTCEIGIKCHWFGALIGCYPKEYCGLQVREMCLARKLYCRWSSHTGCVSKGVL